MKFIRQEFHKRKRLKAVWRKPKGSKSKLRLRNAHKKLVTPGYGTPKKDKPVPVIISNVAQLSELDPKTHEVIIAGSVGSRKRVEIIKNIGKFKILNLKDPEAYIEKITKKLQERKQKEKKEKKVIKKEEKSIEDKLTGEEKKKVEKQEIDRLLTKKF